MRVNEAAQKKNYTKIWSIHTWNRDLKMKYHIHWYTFSTFMYFSVIHAILIPTNKTIHFFFLPAKLSNGIWLFTEIKHRNGKSANGTAIERINKNTADIGKSTSNRFD